MEAPTSSTPPYIGETFIDKAKRKFLQEPMVPIGALLTVACLGSGFRAFQKGNAPLSQKMMRFRIIAQAATILIVGVGAFAGLKPHDRPVSMEDKLARLERGNSGD